MNQKEIDRERICNNVFVREADGEKSRTITGYALLFNVPSDPLYSDESEEVREIIDPSAITEALLRESDIKMTMFHDRQLILARSKNGEGTLSYNIDEKGVSFSFDAPNTADGDKALELVKRGDISGCSFMFSTQYYNDEYVERSCKKVGDKREVEYRVKSITGIFDFTLAADPAYPSTSVEAREFLSGLQQEQEQDNKNKMREQISEMRKIASCTII